MTAPLYVLAAGGTGGHLFPAEALASELIARGSHVVVMTDQRTQRFRRRFADARIVGVPAATIARRSPLGRLAALAVIGIGVVVAFAKLLALRPRAVVGFGGYPTLPVMTAAWLARLPSALHEQNAVMGRVNRLLAPHVRGVASSLPLARFALADTTKVVLVGNPVRPEVGALATSAYAPPDEGGTLHLLVFGGSQGARALSAVVPEAVALLSEGLRRRLSIAQQCRAEDVRMVTRAYHAVGLPAEVAPFFDNLPARMAAAHLVIARAGASTLAELTVVGRPSILVPYPHAADDHQAANARVLAAAGAAWVIGEESLSPRALAVLLEDIFTNPERLAQKAAAAKRLGRPRAAQDLADLVERLSGEGVA